MYERFLNCYFQKCQIYANRPVLVGVSGGLDSICLLDLISRLETPAVVAHFNHKIRPESQQDARFVERIARSYDLPYICGEESVPDFAETKQVSIEEAARITRYQFLFDQALNFHCQAVAVAHNADDQVETVLMHLLRGAGLDGLKGMTYHLRPNPWSDSIPLIRPLLGVWRSEIVQYCHESELAAIEDYTNMDTRLFRNRLRHELIPVLETYVPGVKERTWKMAELLQGDYQAMDEITLQVWSDILSRRGMDFIVLRLPALQQQSLGIQRRLVRKAIEELKPDSRDIDYAIVKRVLDFISKPSQSRRADIGLGLRVQQENNELWLATWETEVADEEWLQLKGEINLPIPGKLSLEHGWTLEVALIKDPETAANEARQNKDPYRAWLALEKDRDHLLIRNRKPGDIIKPLGMNGQKMKLSDFMINLKMPQNARALWPLVCVGDEIAWVPGYRMAHPFRIGKADSGKMITLRFFCP